MSNDSRAWPVDWTAAEYGTKRKPGETDEQLHERVSVDAVEGGPGPAERAAFAHAIENPVPAEDRIANLERRIGDLERRLHEAKANSDDEYRRAQALAVELAYRPLERTEAELKLLAANRRLEEIEQEMQVTLAEIDAGNLKEYRINVARAYVRDMQARSEEYLNGWGLEEERAKKFRKLCEKLERGIREEGYIGWADDIRASMAEIEKGAPTFRDLILRREREREAKAKERAAAAIKLAAEKLDVPRDKVNEAIEREMAAIANGTTRRNDQER